MDDFSQPSLAAQDGDLSSGGMVQSAPPPPSEVKVRTMRSDLASMARSGGGLPRFENVKISGLALEKKTIDSATARKNFSVLFLVAIALIIALGVAGYFAYKAFYGAAPQLPGTNTNSGAAAPASSGTTPATSNNGQPPATTNVVPAAAQNIVHVSVFKKPVDQTITVSFPADGTVQSSADLESYSQKLSSALAAVSKTPSFVEIDAKFSDGHDLGINDLLAKAGAQVLGPQFLAAHFSPDATYFAYHDKNGFWPGYVLTLNAGENWLFLKNDVQKLETSPALSNMFLGSVGSASGKTFVDGTVASTTVRTLAFSGSPAATFVYGWTGNYLVLSTSPDGFSQAVARL